MRAHYDQRQKNRKAASVLSSVKERLWTSSWCWAQIATKNLSLTPLCKVFSRTAFLQFECPCDLSFGTHTREAQELEQLDVECTVLFICQSNHRVGVPKFFDDWEWCHSLWQSKLCGYHAALVHISFQRLLNVCKSVNVGGFTLLLSVHRPITLVVFSHPMTHHPSQKIMEGMILCLGYWSPNVVVVTNSLCLITLGFLCQSPHRVPFFILRLCNFHMLRLLQSVSGVDCCEWARSWPLTPSLLAGSNDSHSTPLFNAKALAWASTPR